MPHTTLRSLEVSGRILDARTQIPIQGVVVCLADDPQTSCLTDSSGKFLLKATYNFHPGAVPPEGDWPARTYLEDKIIVSHPDYVTRRINHWPVEKGSDKGDILLESK